MTGLSRRLALGALVSYVLATFLGVLMRLQLAGVGIDWPFDHILHAHSHVLYFGWAGLGVLAPMLTLPRVGSRLLDVLSVGVAVAMVPLGLAFLAFGYNPVSIAVSTVVMFGWYGVAATWWRATRGERAAHLTAFRAGVVYLVVASVGVWVLAGLQASGRGTPFTESLAVHAFLSGFGWFVVLTVVGVLLQQSGRLGLSFDEGRVVRAVRWWAALAWATFPLGVAGGPEWLPLGPIARVAGVVAIVPTATWVAQLWRAAPNGRAGSGWRWAAGWFGLTGVTLASVSVFGSAAIDFAGRQGIVIHLHALFVGFVTTTLVLVHRPSATTALAVHEWSLVVMLGSLAVSVVAWPSVMTRAAAGGAVILWMSGVAWATRARAPEGTPHRSALVSDPAQVLQRGEDLVGGRPDHRQ